MMISRPYLHNLIPLAIIVPLRDSLMDDDTKRKTCITIKDVPCKQEIIKENMNQSPKGDRICTMCLAHIRSQVTKPYSFRARNHQAVQPPSYKPLGWPRRVREA